MRFSALLVLAMGCDARPAPAPRPRAEAAPSIEGGCTLDAPHTWLRDAGGRGAIALGVEGDRRLVVFASERELRARAVSPDGSPRGSERRVPAPGTEGLVVLEPRGARQLLVARGACDEGAHCLVARVLSDDGLVGEPRSIPLPGPIRTLRRAASEGATAPLFVAWSSAGGERGLERYAIDDEGALDHARIALGSEPASDEQPIEILGLAAERERFAAIFRRGPTEDARSRVFLATRDDHRELAVLHESLAIDAIALEGDVLSLITTFEFSRPHYVRIRLGEDEPLEAHELADDAPIAAPLADRERAELDVDARGLWLRRRSPAGYPRGARVRIASGLVGSAAIARTSDGLLVGWLADGAVHGRVVRCP